MNELRVVKLQKLLSSEKAEIANAPEEGKNAQSYKLLKKHLPLITCVCGAEILVVPDLRAMDLAIEAHVAEHRKKVRTPSGKVCTSEDISQLLSQLALMKINETSSKNLCRGNL